MDGLWEKISSYNIFNNLFPGALFIYLLERMTNIVLSGDDLIKNVVLYYFVGLVIGRIGSIVLEPFLKLSRLIKFAPYKDYVSACGVDGKIETLQEIANMYRTIFSMSIILLATLCVVGRFTGETYG
ncbi:TPA: phosphohistidine phosphatase, partial [Escherichia coli]|nr:phosphohistidine phosphatase [Escherichia coli]